MAAKMGLDPDVLVGEVVNSGHRAQLRLGVLHPAHRSERTFRISDGYPMGHAYKDLVSGAEAGQCMPLPVLAAATATYQTALLRGLGTQDKGAMVQVFEDLLGVQFRSRSPNLKSIF